MTLVLTPDLMSKLTAVNTAVNDGDKYVRDDAKFGDEDFWHNADFTDREGDCKDLAIAKCMRLVREGVDRKDLRYALCYVETGECHAILAAITDQGVLILDNRYLDIMAWKDLPYRWIECEVPGQQLWQQLGDAGFENVT